MFNIFRGFYGVLLTFFIFQDYNITVLVSFSLVFYSFVCTGSKVIGASFVFIIRIYVNSFSNKF